MASKKKREMPKVRIPVPKPSKVMADPKKAADKKACRTKVNENE